MTDQLVTYSRASIGNAQTEVAKALSSEGAKDASQKVKSVGVECRGAGCCRSDGFSVNFLEICLILGWVRRAVDEIWGDFVLIFRMERLLHIPRAARRRNDGMQRMRRAEGVDEELGVKHVKVVFNRH